MYSIKQTLLFIFICATSLYTTAQNNQFTGSVFWRISGNGLTANSYIFGTNHVLSKSFLNKIDGLNDILDSCQQVVGEVDMAEIPTHLEAFKKAALMPEGKSYTQLLNKAEYNKLDSVLQANIKTSLSKIEMLNPISIRIMYSISLYYRISNGGGYLENMDNYFQEYARAQGKNIVGLESLEQQIELIYHSTPLEKQISGLLCFISSDVTAAIMALDKYYQSGDLIGLEKIANEDEDEDCPAIPDERDRIGKDRNNNWLKVLPDIMQNKPSFIAVGCMHLVGEDGLLNRLSEMGYTIELIPMNP